MKFSVAAVFAAAAAGVSAHGHNNVTYTTVTVDEYSTYCNAPTQITHGNWSTTVTKTGWVTVTGCPCTLTKPVTTTTEVVCNTCAPTEVPPPAVSTPAVPPPAGTGETLPPAETPPTAGAGKAAALSGAGLAGVVGLAAFVL